MNTQTYQSNAQQPIQIQLQYPQTPTTLPPPNPLPAFPTYAYPMPPQPCHKPKLVNGYPRWNRYRRLHRSHLRMKNVDWASDDEDECAPPPYYPPYPYPYPHSHHGPNPYMPYPMPNGDDPFAPPGQSSQNDGDEYGDDIIDDKQNNPSVPYPVPTPPNPINNTPPPPKNNVQVQNHIPANGIYTNNDEQWTVTTYTKADDDDCSCFSGDTNTSDVHQYIIG